MTHDASMGSPSWMQRALGYWFEPAPPTNLAVSRALFYTGLLVFYWNDDFSGWGSVSRAFWMPMPAFEAFGLRPLSADALSVVQTGWRVALGLSAVGLFTRASMVAAAALGFYLLGLPHNFGHLYHFDALLVIAMLALSCSRAGDACSLDSWLAGRESPAPSGEYTWPIRVVWLSMSLVFLGAGLSKLRHGGSEWILSSNMAIILTRAAYNVSDADPLTTAGLWIAARPWLAESVALLTLTIELTFASALVSVRARVVLVPAAAAMLLGIRALMGPTFAGFLITNVFWVPWDAVGARLAAWNGARSKEDQPPGRIWPRRGRPDPSAEDGGPSLATHRGHMDEIPPRLCDYSDSRERLRDACSAVPVAGTDEVA